MISLIWIKDCRASKNSNQKCAACFVCVLAWKEGRSFGRFVLAPRCRGATYSILLANPIVRMGILAWLPGKWRFTVSLLQDIFLKGLLLIALIPQTQSMMTGCDLEAGIHHGLPTGGPKCPLGSWLLCRRWQVLWRNNCTEGLYSYDCFMVTF